MEKVSKFAYKNQLHRYQLDLKFRKYVNVTLTFTAVAIFTAFAIRPSVLTLVKLMNEINNYEKVNEQLEDKISKINEIRSKPEEYEQYKVLINKALPSSPEEGNFIRNLNFAAARSNIAITDIVFSTEENSELGELTFQISLSGSYRNVSDFIANCHKLLRITNVRSVNVIPDRQTTGYIAVSISGSAYYYSNDTK